MFQQDALLPWKTVLENVRFGLDLRGGRGRQAHDQATGWIERVGLQGFADRYPYQLSGGMRKRVAMAQAWIVKPDILLMDEPFGALDVHTRLRMESEILGLWAEAKQTVIFVTHDLRKRSRWPRSARLCRPDRRAASSADTVSLSRGPET
jgi:NitT/TauT family transport system ATP-binding protein